MMWFVLQIAAGVFLGLWAFRWWMMRPAREPRPPRDWVKAGIIGLTAIWPLLWLLHLAMMAA
jgi:hypothetical protein